MKDCGSFARITISPKYRLVRFYFAVNVFTATMKEAT